MSMPTTAEDALIWVAVTLIGLFVYVVKTEFASLRKEMGGVRKAVSGWTHAINRMAFVMAQANDVDLAKYDFVMGQDPSAVNGSGAEAGGAG